MSVLGYIAAKGLVDLVNDELAPSPDRGDAYLLPDERARQSAVARLAEEASLEAGKVEVRVLSGVLQLTGSVPDEAARARAAELCAAVDGVTQVENELTVA